MIKFSITIKLTSRSSGIQYASYCNKFEMISKKFHYYSATQHTYTAIY